MSNANDQTNSVIQNPIEEELSKNFPTGREETFQGEEEPVDRDAHKEPHNDHLADNENSVEETTTHDKQDKDRNEAEAPWMQRRIARFTRQLREVERQKQTAYEEKEQLRRALAHARGEDIPDHNPPSSHQEPTYEQHPDRNSIEENQQQGEFVKRCNDLADKYSAQYGNDGLAKAMSSLYQQGGLDAEREDHRALLSELTERPNADEILHALSLNPNDASEIFDAPSRRQYALLDRFAQNMAKSKPVQHVSKAPRPASNLPTRGRTSSEHSFFDPNTSAEDFASQFDKIMSNR